MVGKNKSKKLIPLMLILLLILTACGQPGQKDSDNQGEKVKEGYRLLTDYTGRRVKIPEKVESIICVNVGSLRLTTYMQALDLLVGLEQNEVKATASKPFSYLNRELFASLPFTGDNGLTYDEEIIKINPQVIIAALEKEEAQALEDKLGIPVFTIAIIDSLGKPLFDSLTLLGQVYGKEERADQLIDYFQALGKDLAHRTASILEEDKPKVYVGGISYKGGRGLDGTEAKYSPFDLIGAKNLADLTGRQGPINIDLEQLVEWDPDIIFLDFNGMELINDYYEKNPSFFASLKAVENDQIYSQISFRSNAMNVELAYADAYYAGKIIYPEEFADIDPIEKADEIFLTVLGENYYETLKENGYEFKKMKLGE